MAADAEQRTPFTCLVADDSQFARRNIAGIIMKMGGTVVGEAANGIEAVELYAQLRPDIVVLDITMPQLDGIATLGRIIEQDPNAKVVIISALGNKEMVWKAITLGAKSFITKPYTPDYAGMIIEDVLRGVNGGRKP